MITMISNFDVEAFSRNTNLIKRESKIGYLKVSNWKSWNNPGDLSLPLNCASALKIYTQRPE